MSAPLPSSALPRTAAAQRDWLRLIRSPRIGVATFRKLLQEHGTATTALEALPQVAASGGVKNYQITSAQAAEQELAAGLAAGAQPLFWGLPPYPAHLADIADAPPVLWARGDPELATDRTIALVGARNASALGQRMAGHLARELGATGWTIVSGLARGIDTAAHEASVATGTIAVLAGGIDRIYPRENLELARQIAEEGLILSEMPPGLQAQARHFPRRNRIISGLCPALVVIEGAAKSGSLISARTALDQGREVFAVPGHPFDARAAGCNLLIRDGATLVRSAADITDALDHARPERPVPGPTPAQPPLPLASPVDPSDLDHRILGLLSPAPISEDALIRQLGSPPPPVLSVLGELDLQGRIARHPGGLVSLPA
ncbi:MAG: DNA-processing protein DprA [Pseudomonadota bacterium]